MDQAQLETELHAARAALAHLNATLETRVEERTLERDRAWKISRDLQVVVDADGTIRAANQAWTTILGWQPLQVVGHNHTDFNHPDDHGSTEGVLTNASSGLLPAYDVRVRHLDGSYRWISWVAAPEQGLIYASGRHVTAAKEAAAGLALAQEQLRQSQKMEAVGQLTGGVAHDFNNLLQVISGNLHLISRSVVGNEQAERRLTNAQAAVRRGAKLASQLLAFSRRQALEPKVVNIGHFVTGMEDMLHRAIGETIDIQTSVAPDLWNALVDPAQIENALLNLAINARDAMDGSGRLTIEASNAELDARYAQSRAEVSAGQYVRLAVTDTGSGMTPEIRAQVFEPFFSTKPAGSGTGLGLSMVYGFVKQSGGHIDIYSEPGHGTTMTLYLPRAHASEEVQAVAAPEPVTGGSETILVAEDDEAVRSTVVDMLRELGYRVLTAKDAASALTVIESGVYLDLLFTDIVMPGTLQSPELARIAQLRQPELAVLFTSGYPRNAIVHGGRLDPGVELLPKPYTRETLARKVRHVLANQAQRNRAGAERAGQVPAGADIAHVALRVLLVEDDPLIRQTTAELLQDLGHQVTAAADAASAMSALHAAPADAAIQVLFTDIGLHGTSGDELAAQARRLRPGLRVVFATGNDRLPARGPDGAADVLLRKPYDRHDIATALRAATA